MNTGPYSDEKVQSYLQENFVPIKSQCYWDKRTDAMKQYNVSWTPTLLVLDASGREHHRMVGYVPVDDFLAHLILGKGKLLFDRFRFADAMSEFAAVEVQHPASGAAPEAAFYFGVAEYWHSHDPKALRRAYDTLSARFPASEWARRSVPYKEIQL